MITFDTVGQYLSHPARTPYAAKLKKSVTMRLSEDVVAYFKSMADEVGSPY